jgi:hypothetical protein
MTGDMTGERTGEKAVERTGELGKTGITTLSVLPNLLNE